MVQEIAVDTNVLVRFLSGDGAEQFQRAVELFSSNVVWVSNAVLIETEWVLRKPLAHSKEVCIHAFETLIDLENVEFEDWSAFDQVIQAYKIGMDFADAMHLYTANRNTRTLYSFDKILVKHAVTLSAKAQLL